MENCHLGIEPFIVKCSRDAYGPFKEIIGSDIDVFEVFTVIFFNQRSKSTGWMKVSTGGITSSIVDVRILMSAALNCLATQMMICHNHPSGGMKPSNEDIKITNQIKEACKIMNINLMDHLIISEKEYYSFADEGLI